MLWRSLLLVCLVAVLGCDSNRLDTKPDDPKQVEEIGRCIDHDPLRRAFFGETHIHSNRSLDTIALTSSTQLSARRVLSPEDAYRYARGEPVQIPTTLDGSSMETIQIERPLDFAIVTDHAEFLGVEGLCRDPESRAYDTTECEHVRVPESAPSSGGLLGGAYGPFAATLAVGFEPHEICGEDGEDCLRFSDDVWGEIQEATEAAYDRTEACTFASVVTIPVACWGREGS